MNANKESRICTECGEEKQLTEFYCRKRGGTVSKCKECLSKKYYEFKEEVFRHYSSSPPVCATCGETALNRLCLDHVNGGGREHLKSIGLYNEKHNKIHTGSAFYCYLRRENYPQDPPLQVLCKECNKKKQIQNKER